MKVTFLAQPYPKQLGSELLGLLSATPGPTVVTVVSAFVGQQAIRRLKRRLHELHSAGAQITFVIGVDMGGTSREVLQELAKWPVEVFVYKNRRGRVTFHPKVYLVQSPHQANLFVGSNNLTDGGLFTNYEAAAHIEYDLPADQILFNRGKVDLQKFLTPIGPVVRKLDHVYLAELLSCSEIPSEEEARRRRASAANSARSKGHTPVFGYEPLPSAPPLSKEVSDAVLKDVVEQIEARRKAKALARSAASKSAGKPGKAGKATSAAKGSKNNVLAVAPSAQIYPQAFYVELVKTKGKIPGEQRVPLEAVAAARAFWHWPSAYVKTVNPRKGNSKVGSEPRIYHNFYSTWRIRETGNPTHDVTKKIRMYFYENSSDFRFYSSAISGWGQAGDIVRITPSDETGIDYECELSKAGTAQHAAWSAICTQASSHTERRYGFE